MPTSKTPQSGFSLVELLIAILILAVGLLGLAQLQITAITANAQSDSITVANALAQKAIEDIAAMSIDNPIFSTAVTGAVWTESPFVAGVITVDGAGDYVVTYDVVPDFPPASPVTGLSQVTVHVRSAGAVANVLGNRQRSVDAITFKRSF